MPTHSNSNVGRWTGGVVVVKGDVREENGRLVEGKKTEGGGGNEGSSFPLWMRLLYRHAGFGRCAPQINQIPQSPAAAVRLMHCHQLRSVTMDLVFQVLKTCSGFFTFCPKHSGIQPEHLARNFEQRK